MHIVIACYQMDGPSSVALVALRQARELARRWEVTLVSDRLPPEPPWAAVKGVKVPDLFHLRRLRHVPDQICYARAVRGCLSEIARGKPIDFVLFHDHGTALIAGVAFRKASGVPFGYIVHGDIFDRPAGMYDWRLATYYRYVTRRVEPRSDLIVALSPRMADSAIGRGARREVVQVIPHGIDPGEIGLEVEPLPKRAGSEFRVLYVGRLSVEKGLSDLLRACAAASRAVDLHLDLVGTGPMEMELRELVTQLGIERRVTFAGHRPRVELGALYARSDVLCLPSINEPFGLVIGEALAAGTPVIATEVCGAAILIEPGVNGLLVPVADAPALAAAIERLATDVELRKRLTAAARPSVLPRFGWPAIGEQLAAAIEARVGQPPSAAGDQR